MTHRILKLATKRGTQMKGKLTHFKEKINKVLKWVDR